MFEKLIPFTFLSLQNGEGERSMKEKYAEYARGEKLRRSSIKKFEVIASQKKELIMTREQRELRKEKQNR